MDIISQKKQQSVLIKWPKRLIKNVKKMNGTTVSI